MNAEVAALKVGVDWVDLEVTGEPFVEYTMRGYAPVVPVANKGTGGAFKLYISASSLGRALEPLRKANDGKFTGLRFRISKESDDRMASYRLEKV